MISLFSYNYNGGPFELFSPAHVIAMTIICSFILLLYVFKDSLKNEKFGRKVRYALAFLLICSEGALTIWYMAVGEWSISYSLPLHLCNLSSFLAALMLIFRSYSLFEFVYLVGVSGTVQAILTPDLGSYSFPHFCAFQFFVAHGSVVLAGCYMIFVEGFRPHGLSIRNAFISLNLYALIIGVINQITGGNYLFLSHKPENPSLMDLLGPWPWYIISLEIVALFMFILLYSPFAVQRWLNKSIKKKEAVRMKSY